jgi:predicted transposase YdaD
MLEEGIARGRAEGKAEGLAEGMEKGKAEGIAEGLAKGIRENQLSTARKMLKLGMAVEEISEITGLIKEEIGNL